MKKTKELSEKLIVKINAPNFKRIPILIENIEPYVQNRFPEISINEMMDKMKKGDVDGEGRKKRAPKDFNLYYRQSLHITKQGWYGIPAAGIRTGLIDACRVLNLKMRFMQLAFFVEADGFDMNTGQPLVKIIKGEPEMFTCPAANANGSTDIRARGRFMPGAQALVRLCYDADMVDDVQTAVNLMANCCMRIGFGAGRPFSQKSRGCGWGRFKIVNQ